MKPNACDKCGRERSTLYERPRGLICYHCLPEEALSGVGARRAIKASVTGTVNIECRRKQLAGAAPGAGRPRRAHAGPGDGLRCSS